MPTVYHIRKQPMAREFVRDGLTSERLDGLLDTTRYVSMCVKFAERGAAKASATADALPNLVDGWPVQPEKGSLSTGGVV